MESLLKNFMSFGLLALVLLICATPVFAGERDRYGREYIDEVMAPESYFEKSSYKLVRGVANVVTCPGELPKQVVVTIRDRGPMGVLLGTLKGLGMVPTRCIVGVWEVATSPLPNSFDGDFSAILKPEFVWTPSDKIHH